MFSVGDSEGAVVVVAGAVVVVGAGVDVVVVGVDGSSLPSSPHAVSATAAMIATAPAAPAMRPALNPDLIPVCPIVRQPLLEPYPRGLAVHRQFNPIFAVMLAIIATQP
jgi:hypothetical protein